MDSPSIRPFPWVTAYQTGGRSPSTATSHAKRRCRRENVATFLVGSDRSGEGTVTLTPAATKHCRDSAKVCRLDSDRPRAASPWPGAASPAALLPLVGPTPLAGRLAREGVVEEEIQAGRGVGGTKHVSTPHIGETTWGQVPPAGQPTRPRVRGDDWGPVGAPHLATKILPGVPPYFPNFEDFLGPLQPPLGLQLLPCPPPSVPIDVRGGVRTLRTLRPKFCKGLPPIFKNNKTFLACCCLCRDPSHFPSPSLVPVGVHGGVRSLQPLRPKFCQGFPPSCRINIFLIWARCRLHYPARLHPKSAGIHPWVRTVQWGWGRRTPFGTTGVGTTSCTTGGIPARLTKAAWRGGVI